MRWTGLCASCVLLLMVKGSAAALWPAPSQVPACKTIRGRAHLFIADGQLRILQLGTRHEFEPDASSAQRVQGWLQEGVHGPAKPDGPPPIAAVYLFGDFVVCPTKPFQAGAVQPAVVKSVSHRRYELKP